MRLRIIVVCFFAEDWKLYQTVSDQQDCPHLQTVLNKLCEWCSIMKLSFNIIKCKVKSYSRKSKKTLFPDYVGKVVHIHKKVIKTNPVIGFIIPNSKNINNDHFPCLLQDVHKIDFLVMFLCRLFNNGVDSPHLFLVKQLSNIVSRLNLLFYCGR